MPLEGKFNYIQVECKIPPEKFNFMQNYEVSYSNDVLIRIFIDMAGHKIEKKYGFVILEGAVKEE